MKKITVPKLALAVIVPASAVLPFVVTSCSNIQDSSHIKISDKTPVVDTETGGAKAKVTMDCNPQYNEALVSVINRSGDYMVNLYKDGEEPFSGQYSLKLPVVDHTIDLNFSFDEYVGQDTSTLFNLEVDYFDDKGVVKAETIRDLTLSIKYNRPAQETDHIFTINDLHGAAEGFGDSSFQNTSYKNPGIVRLAQKIDEEFKNNPGSILLSGGDNNSGDAFSTAMHGETIYPLLKSMDCRYSAVGNHAFEWGLDDMASWKFDQLARTDKTDDNYFICGNILSHPAWQHFNWIIDENDPNFNWCYNIWLSQRAVWADPFKIVSLNGHLICLLGLTTTGALTDGNKTIVNYLSIIPYEAALYYSTKYCHDLFPDLYDQIDSFVLLTHVESEDTMDPSKSSALQLAKDLHIYEPSGSGYSHTKKVSAILSAHSHKNVDDSWIKNDFSNQDIYVGQANTAGRDYLDLSLKFDNTKEAGKRWIVPVTEQEKKDIFKVKHVDNIEYGEQDPFSKDHPYDEWTAEEKQQLFETAKTQYDYLLSHPSTPYLNTVTKEFTKQEAIVNAKLSSKVAQSEIDMDYSPLHEPGKVLGHDYIIPNHINSQVGAWINMAQIAGFDSVYSAEIADPASSIQFPAISFYNMDSVTTEFKKGDILLRDMYQIQTYENPMYFGYLSIWQLANIVDYLLSGQQSFIYGSDHNRDYLTQNQFCKPDEQISFPAGTHELYQNSRSGDQFPIQCADSGTIGKCLYLCGPYQWYGFQINVEKIVNPDLADTIDATYRLHYVTSNTDGRSYPDIKIYNPDENPSKDLLNVSNWLTAEQWEKEIGLIPCVVNSFIFTAGGGQSTMFAPYFKFNEQKYGDKYKWHNFSELSRDMLIEFCKLTVDSGLYQFEMPKEISDSLILGM